MECNRLMCLLTVVVLLLNGCSITARPKSASHNNLNSVLWVQTSAEYKANSLQAYNAAANIVDKARNDKSWTAILEQGSNFARLPPAVIMDIDETVLDNSQYQAQLVLDNGRFNPASWDQWLAMGAATAVPGAVPFINRIAEEGIAVYYISNRPCAAREGAAGACPQKQDTIDNMHKVGVHTVTLDQLMFQNEKPGWGSQKESRREAVAENYRVIMLFGDDLGDFLPFDKKNTSVAERDSLVRQYKENWGRKWFSLANPTYGSWLNILQEPRSSRLDAIE